MAPIRTAIIGLSASAKTSWAAGAHLPYLQSSNGKERYEIVALLNSSEKAARAAIESFKLPSTTKAFGDPESLAADPDIDLVVNCTRVDVHHDTILPSVKAGKNVYVEWPLAQDAKHVRELVDAADKSGSRTIVGIQGRAAPVNVKLREILESGRIGKVLSSELFGFGGTNDRVLIPETLSYFGERAVGGNLYTINYGHLFDQIQHVLGDFQSLRGQFQRARGMQLKDSTGKVVGDVDSELPDLIINTATLAGSHIVKEGATVLTRFRRGQQFPGTPPLTWTINGELGEIRLLAWGGTALHASVYDKSVTIEVHDFASDKVTPVEWDWADWQKKLPVNARSVGALYEAYADGRKVPGFKDALVRHEQLETALERWQA